MRDLLLQIINNIIERLYTSVTKKYYFKQQYISWLPDILIETVSVVSDRIAWS